MVQIHLPPTNFTITKCVISWRCTRGLVLDCFFKIGRHEAPNPCTQNYDVHHNVPLTRSQTRVPFPIEFAWRHYTENHQLF